jgi:hypothetical protein
MTLSCQLDALAQLNEMPASQVLSPASAPVETDIAALAAAQIAARFVEFEQDRDDRGNLPVNKLIQTSA